MAKPWVILLHTLQRHVLLILSVSFLEEARSVPDHVMVFSRHAFVCLHGYRCVQDGSNLALQPAGATWQRHSSNFSSNDSFTIILRLQDIKSSKI